MTNKPPTYHSEEYSLQYLSFLGKVELPYGTGSIVHNLMEYAMVLRADPTMRLEERMRREDRRVGDDTLGYGFERLGHYLSLIGPDMKNFCKGEPVPVILLQDKAMLIVGKTLAGKVGKPDVVQTLDSLLQQIKSQTGT